MDYKTSGVDIEAGRSFVNDIKDTIKSTHRPEVLGGFGGFNGMMKIISKNGIGMDSYLDRFFNSYETTTNYPPYNLIHVNNVESILEIALAGFSKNELNVYTEYGKLIVEGKKEAKEKESEYVYQGLAQRSFNRTWSLSEDIEVREVQFKDGLLTVKLGKVVPEHHARKDYM